MAIIAEYIWVDGTEPTALVRSKTKIIHDKVSTVALTTFPQWAFDGSSTNQAPGGNSDRLLEPVCFVPDPLRGENSYLVLCEVLNPDGTPHSSNHRAVLRAAMNAGGEASDPWVAFEQEYTFFRGSRPLGFGDDRRYPAAQGPYYCGVGADEVYGRPVVEKHLALCLKAGIELTGINAEVMPGQWEYQCGGPGVDVLELDVGCGAIAAASSPPYARRDRQGNYRADERGRGADDEAQPARDDVRVAIFAPVK